MFSYFSYFPYVSYFSHIYQKNGGKIRIKKKMVKKYGNRNYSKKLKEIEKYRKKYGKNTEKIGKKARQK